MNSVLTTYTGIMKFLTFHQSMINQSITCTVKYERLYKITTLKYEI